MCKKLLNNMKNLFVTPQMISNIAFKDKIKKSFSKLKILLQMILLYVLAQQITEVKRKIVVTMIVL